MLPYGVRRSWNDLVRKDSSISTRKGHLTDVCRCGHRSDVAFVESLVPKFDYAIEARRSNASVASVGLTTTINPRIGTGLQGPHGHTFRDSFTYSSGPSAAAVHHLRPSFAKRLNSAPGNHSGTYPTSKRIINRVQAKEIKIRTNVLGTCQQGMRPEPKLFLCAPTRALRFAGTCLRGTRCSYRM